MKFACSLKAALGLDSTNDRLWVSVETVTLVAADCVECSISLLFRGTHESLLWRESIALRDITEQGVS